MAKAWFRNSRKVQVGQTAITKPTDSTGSASTGTLPLVRSDTTAHCASDAADGIHVLATTQNLIIDALKNAGITL